MSGQTRHFSIGEISVSLASECRLFIDEFLTLYSNYEKPCADEKSIEVTVRPHSRFPWRRGPYTIQSPGADDCLVPRRFEVLPHLEWFVSWQVIARRNEFLQLHAASMERDGQALVMPGDPGSGKSTLSAGLLARGWSYLCDEFSLIDPRTLSAHPFPRAICAKESSFPVIDDLGLRLCRKTPYHKPMKGRVAFLNPLDVRANAVGQPSPVRWIVFPKYSAGAMPALIPVSRAQAAYDMAKQCFNFGAFGSRAIDILADLVRGADCYRLVAGDIHETCDVLESLLSIHEARKAG